MSKKVTDINYKSKGMRLGLLLFLVILAYIVVAIFNYFNQDRIESYQVKVGSLSTNNIFKGVALREEYIVRATSSGYANYFARESERVGVGSLVYSLDELGRVSEFLSNNDNESNLTAKDLSELKTDILSFANNFTPEDFSLVYDFKYNVQGTVMKLSNSNILKNIEQINSGSNADSVNFNYSPKSGYVVYSVDGYEDLSITDMTAELVDYKKYEQEGKKKQLISNNLIAEGDPAYKLSTNEDWSIVIMVDEDKAQALLDEEYVKVKFLKNQNISWGKVSVYTNANKETFVALTFNNSLMSFCTDRFIDIELILKEDNGLKVPNSSIIEKEFFIIPKEYMTKGGYSSSTGVFRQIYLEDGKPSAEFVNTTIYNETETDYYIDDMTLRMGDVLVAQDSNSQITLSAGMKGTLIGVYNINKGYADFKQIQKLYENEEYSIIKPNLAYGLCVYDYIVLDASTVKDDELIYD